MVKSAAILLSVLLAAAAAAAAAPDEQAPAPPATATVTVTVADVRNARGQLRVGVFDRDNGFPRSRDGAILWRSIPAGADEKVVAIDLPPGDYAVVVLHDENANKKLDTNFIGVPKEGYGVTNNPKPTLRAATFKEARMTLPAEGKRVTVSIQSF